MKTILTKAILLPIVPLIMFTLAAPTVGASDNTTAQNKIVIGKLVCGPNPCTTDPCLPGMILYIETLAGDTYELTIDGAWIWECSFDWNGFYFEDGDYVLLFGQVADTEFEILFIYNLLFLQTIL